MTAAIPSEQPAAPQPTSKGRPRLVFMGTPAFAVESLLACFDVAEVVAVVTQPDKPKGRGQALAMPPVKVLAQARGVPVLQPQKVRNTPFADELRAFAPDVCVVTAYGKILPPPLLELAPWGCLNVHASLLPRFRGAAPIQWALASGDVRTGVCLMKMDEGMDTGPLLASRSLDILPTDTSETLHEKLARLGGALLREELPRYLSGELRPIPQPSEGVVMAPLIAKDEGRLDFRRTAAELERRLRAFTPWPGTFTQVGGGLLKVHKVELGTGRGQPGAVLAAGSEGLEVACKEGSLVLLEVQPEGRRRMTIGEYLASRQLEVGERPFDTP